MNGNVHKILGAASGGLLAWANAARPGRTVTLGELVGGVVGGVVGGGRQT